MRTTIDLPDELYRTLKARAAMSGLKLRELVRHYLEQGLRQPGAVARMHGREAPPVLIPARGRVIPAVSRDELSRIDEAEDLEKHARSSGR